MKLQIIYTFDNKPQEIWNYKYIEGEPFTSKETFIKWLRKQLTTDENKNLLKVSCCVIGGSIVMPEWYKKANGKLYFDNI